MIFFSFIVLCYINVGSYKNYKYLFNYLFCPAIVKQSSETLARLGLYDKYYVYKKLT